MSPLTPSLRLVVITLVVGCVVASLTGATAKERAADTGLKVAVVNPARIILETKYYKTETDKLSKLQADMQTMVRTWEQNNLLSQADQQTLGELVVQEETKEGLDAGKKAQKQQITDRGKALFGELLTLQTKGQLNQVENDRLREFAKAAADTQKREQDKVNTVKAEIDTKLAAIREATDKNARESLNKIAKKDGYNLVFSSEVLLYSENDITEKVLTDLNNSK